MTTKSLITPSSSQTSILFIVLTFLSEQALQLVQYFPALLFIFYLCNKSVTVKTLKLFQTFTGVVLRLGSWSGFFLYHSANGYALIGKKVYAVNNSYNRSYKRPQHAECSCSRYYRNQSYQNKQYADYKSHKRLILWRTDGIFFHSAASSSSG